MCIFQDIFASVGGGNDDAEEAMLQADLDRVTAKMSAPTVEEQSAASLAFGGGGKSDNVGGSTKQTTKSQKKGAKKTDDELGSGVFGVEALGGLDDDGADMGEY